VAQQRAEREGLPLTFLHCDMREIDFFAEFVALSARLRSFAL